MSERLFYAGSALFAAGLIALALVWPQGLGARSPAPFGHDIVIPEYIIAHEARQKRAAEAEKARIAAQEAKAAEIAARQADLAETEATMRGPAGSASSAPLPARASEAPTAQLLDTSRPVVRPTPRVPTRRDMDVVPAVPVRQSVPDSESQPVAPAPVTGPAKPAGEAESV
ncbi:MAG: hypothetical protein ACK41P_07370 [Asticcacaulis sp.]